MPNIHINNLQVCLRGVSPGTAQTAIAQLQGALQTAMRGAGTRSLSAAHLHLGTLRVGTDSSASSIAGALAGSIANQITHQKSKI